MILYNSIMYKPKMSLGVECEFAQWGAWGRLSKVLLPAMGWAYGTAGRLAPSRAEHRDPYPVVSIPAAMPVTVSRKSSSSCGVRRFF